MANEAAIYVRVASEDESEVRLEKQIQEIQIWAQRNGYQVCAIYKDIGSGISEERPGLNQMMIDAEVGKFDAVLIHNPSRLFRNSRLLRRYYHRLRNDFGLRIVFVNYEGQA